MKLYFRLTQHRNMENLISHKHYTVGFCFTENLQEVCLIEKCKPAWQKGLLNGVGGKIEDGEAIIDCMEREFEEEAGPRIRGWKHFLSGDIRCHQGNCIVHYFVVKYGRFNPIIVPEEQVMWYSAKAILEGQYSYIVPNLIWMLPMALLKLENQRWEEPAIWETV